VLDVEALRAAPLLQSLAQTNTPATTAREAPGGTWAQASAVAGRSLLLFDAPAEVAAPIAQIAEILPFPAQGQDATEGCLTGAGSAAAQAGVLGLMVERGRSILVVDLGLVLHGGRAAAPRAILVVRSGEQYLGYAVAGLRAIEPARWEPELAGAGRAAQGRLEQVLRGAMLALVGARESERMVRVIDLQALAEALLGLASPAAMAAELARIPRRPARRHTATTPVTAG
jgi:chemotaxis signal transduction protein